MSIEENFVRVRERETRYADLVVPFEKQHPNTRITTAFEAIPMLAALASRMNDLEFVYIGELKGMNESDIASKFGASDDELKDLRRLFELFNIDFPVRSGLRFNA